MLIPWPLPLPGAFVLAVALLLALLVALAVDRWLGEPPVRLHPVVWMGNYLGWAGKHLQSVTRQNGTSPDFRAFWLGALVWLAGAAIVFIATLALQWGAMALPTAVGAVVMGLLLKPLLAWAMLKGEVLAVEKALTPAQGGSLADGRERLRWLVSRDVTHLTESQVRESAIETLAENLNDSVVAPLFWFLLLGLPGAALYRFANTADAMWGYPGRYQGGNWAWAGKWAARADDVLSWVPARLTALLLVLVAGVSLVGGGVSLRAWPRFSLVQREARRTASPNSGWPMAAMAVALGVCLQKPGVYALNATGRAPQAADTHLAVIYASKVVLALVLIAQAAIIFIALSGGLATPTGGAVP